MKYLLIFFICVSSIANAQSNRQRLEDIENKLDSIREEQEWREFRNKVERSRNENTNTNKFSSTFSNNPSRYKLIFSNSKQNSWLDLTYLTKGNNDEVLVGVTLQYNNPQYRNNLVYFYDDLSVILYCKKNNFFLLSGRMLDSEGKILSKYESSEGRISKGTPFFEIKKYVCPQ